MTDQPEENSPPAQPDTSSSVQADQCELDTLMCVRRAVDKTFNTMCGIRFAERPQIKRGGITVWLGRMRVLKPHYCAFVSVITFRHGNMHVKGFEVHGIMILYIPESTADTLITALGLSTKDVEEFDIMDGCGEFLNVIAGTFKTELYKEGYEELEISVPHNFTSNVDELFDLKQNQKFEMTFTREDAPFFQVDIALDKVQKR